MKEIVLLDGIAAACAMCLVSTFVAVALFGGRAQAEQPQPEAYNQTIRLTALGSRLAACATARKDHQGAYKLSNKQLKAIGPSTVRHKRGAGRPSSAISQKHPPASTAI